MSICRRMQTDLYLSPWAKLKCKWIKYLNINPATSNLLEEKVWIALFRSCSGDNFMNRTLIPQALKSTINKWDLMKLENFCKVKDTINRTKWQSREWKIIFIFTTTYEIKHETPNNPIKNGLHISKQRIFNRGI